MAGAQCPIEVMRRVVEEMGVTYILNGYGQTEASSWIAQTRPHDPLEIRVSTVGRAIDGVEIKIIDPASGQALPAGQVGEICARGFNMLGYHQMPAATHAALDPLGWLHTGDLGSLDQEGYLRISGRLKEVIRRGGQIIFPAAVEEVLFTHPAVNNAQVFGVDHDQLGEEVACWIRLEKGAGLDAAGVRAFLQGKVPDSHIPTHYKFVDSFPMTPLGKIQKFRLRELFAYERGQG
jgi:fatty-acyl-CoA synthase